MQRPKTFIERQLKWVLHRELELSFPNSQKTVTLGPRYAQLAKRIIERRPDLAQEFYGLNLDDFVICRKCANDVRAEIADYERNSLKTKSREKHPRDVKPVRSRNSDPILEQSSPHIESSSPSFDPLCQSSTSTTSLKFDQSEQNQTYDLIKDGLLHPRVADKRSHRDDSFDRETKYNELPKISSMNEKEVCKMCKLCKFVNKDTGEMDKKLTKILQPRESNRENVVRVNPDIPASNGGRFQEVNPTEDTLSLQSNMDDNLFPISCYFSALERYSDWINAWTSPSMIESKLGSFIIRRNEVVLAWLAAVESGLKWRSLPVIQRRPKPVYRLTKDASVQTDHERVYKRGKLSQIKTWLRRHLNLDSKLLDHHAETGVLTCKTESDQMEMERDDRCKMRQYVPDELQKKQVREVQMYKKDKNGIHNHNEDLLQPKLGTGMPKKYQILTKTLSHESNKNLHVDSEVSNSRQHVEEEGRASCDIPTLDRPGLLCNEDLKVNKSNITTNAIDSLQAGYRSVPRDTKKVRWQDQLNFHSCKAKEDGKESLQIYDGDIMPKHNYRKVLLDDGKFKVMNDKTRLDEQRMDRVRDQRVNGNVSASMENLRTSRESWVIADHKRDQASNDIVSTWELLDDKRKALDDNNQIEPTDGDHVVLSSHRGVRSAITADTATDHGGNAKDHRLLLKKVGRVKGNMLRLSDSFKEKARMIGDIVDLGRSYEGFYRPRLAERDASDEEQHVDSEEPSVEETTHRAKLDISRIHQPQSLLPKTPTRTGVFSKLRHSNVIHPLSDSGDIFDTDAEIKMEDINIPELAEMTDYLEKLLQRRRELPRVNRVNELLERQTRYRERANHPTLSAEQSYQMERLVTESIRQRFSHHNHLRDSPYHSEPDLRGGCIGCQLLVSSEVYE